MKKKLTIIELNEFNISFLKESSFKYNLQNLKDLFSLDILETFTNDNKEHHNLDPWVQWVSIHVGQESSVHQILELGDIQKKKITQIWDVLCKLKIKSGIFGAMNAKFNKNEYLKFFIPDPWNFSQPVIPRSMNNFLSLSKYYAKNYKKINRIKIIFNFIRLIYFCLINIKSFFNYNIIRNIFNILNVFKFKSSGLFLINDYLSVIIFLKLKKQYQTEFNIIFLNSLAHFQHNYWTMKNEKENKCFFYILNEIFGLLKVNNEKTLLTNGFSQVQVKKGDYIIYRQKDPDNFLKTFDIKYKNIQQNMTNETRINFKSKNDLEIALKILNDIFIDGTKFLTINVNETFNEILIKIAIHKKIKANYIKIKNKKIKLDDLIIGIERTGSHSQFGNIITDIQIKDKKIYNHEIFNMVNNFYK